MMSVWELFIIAVGLSMDAFAVSICKGLATKKAGLAPMAVTGLYFGGFQALMPFIGYLLGSRFRELITRFDHWIAFILLSVIGINMLREAFGSAEKLDGSFGPRAMLPLAVATSIDALAVGVTFAFLQVQIGAAVSLIGLTTFLFSAAGVQIGSLFGARFRARAEVFGGVVLILMGLKILLEHLGFLG